MSHRTTIHEQLVSTAEVSDAVCEYLKQMNRPNEICVVTSSPEDLMKMTEQKWQHEIQLVKATENVRTNSVDSMRLSNRLTVMESVIFAVAPPADLLQADVIFIPPSEFRHFPMRSDVIVIGVEEDMQNPDT